MVQFGAFCGLRRAFLTNWRAAKAENVSKKYYGMVYDLGYMIYKVFSVVIIRSGERGWISNHIFFTKKFFFVKIMWIQLRVRVKAASRLHN